MITYKTADILAVRGTSWLARGVLRATGNTVSHTGLIVCDSPFPVVIEAEARVYTHDLADSLTGIEHAWLLSDKTLTDIERAQILCGALKFSAETYGYTTIPLQGINSLFHTTWFTDHLTWGINKFPICSYVVAAPYASTGRGFGIYTKDEMDKIVAHFPTSASMVVSSYAAIVKNAGLLPRSTTPADIYKFALDHPDLYTVTPVK